MKTYKHTSMLNADHSEKCFEKKQHTNKKKHILHETYFFHKFLFSR